MKCTCNPIFSYLFTAPSWDWIYSPSSCCFSTLQGSPMRGSVCHAQTRWLQNGMPRMTLLSRPRWSYVLPYSVDPIISSGIIGSNHVHTIHGTRFPSMPLMTKCYWQQFTQALQVNIVISNRRIANISTDFNPTYDYDNLRASSCTSCEVTQVRAKDFSAWSPLC